MSNPARVLHEIYDDWRTRLDSRNGAMHSIVNLDTVDGGQEIVHAARALVRIDELLQQLEADGRYRVALYRRQYPEWWKGVVSYQNGWTTNMGGSSVLSNAHMDEIESFANFLEGKVWDVAPATLGSLRDLLAQARSVLEEDDGLSPELRAYVHRLLQQIQNALDDENVGSTFDYGDAVMRLFVAFKAAEGEGTSKSTLWANLRNSILPGGAVAGVLEAGSIAVQAALGI